MLAAPGTVQRMPDSLSRCPMTDLQPASATPEPTNMPSSCRASRRTSSQTGSLLPPGRQREGQPARHRTFTVRAGKAALPRASVEQLLTREGIAINME